MPKFQYRLRDVHGGLKTGVMEALDQRLAREDLIAQGWRVEQLVPADPQAAATPIPTPPAMVDFSEVFAAAEKKPEPPPPPRAELEKAMQEALKAPPARPAVSAKLDRELRQIRRASIPPVPVEVAPRPPAWRLPVLMGVILLGLVVWIASSSSGADPAGAAPKEAELHDVRVVVRGRLKLSDVRGKPRDARVTLRLPQIPLDVTREGNDLRLSDEGDYQIELAFQSSRVPGQVDVSVEKEGYRPASLKGIPLQGDPLQAELPPVVLEPTH